MAALATGPMTDVGGGGMEAELGAALGDAFDTATGDGGGETSLPSEAGAEGVEAAEPAVDPSVGVDPVDPQETPAEPTATADSPWPVSEDGKTVLMPKAE